MALLGPGVAGAEEGDGVKDPAKKSHLQAAREGRSIM